MKLWPVHMRTCPSVLSVAPARAEAEPVMEGDKKCTLCHNEAGDIAFHSRPARRKGRLSTGCQSDGEEQPGKSSQSPDVVSSESTR